MHFSWTFKNKLLSFWEAERQERKTESSHPLYALQIPPRGGRNLTIWASTTASKTLGNRGVGIGSHNWISNWATLMCSVWKNKLKLYVMVDSLYPDHYNCLTQRCKNRYFTATTLFDHNVNFFSLQKEIVSNMYPCQQNVEGKASEISAR